MTYKPHPESPASGHIAGVMLQNIRTVATCAASGNIAEEHAMIHIIRQEGMIPPQGISFWSLWDRYSFGFIIRVGRFYYRLRYSKHTGILFSNYGRYE